MCITLYVAVFPVGVPIQVTEMTYTFYDIIEDLQPDDYVLWSFDTGNWFTNNQVDIAIMKHLKRKILEDGVKLVAWTTAGVDGIIFIERSWDIIGWDDLEYGEDWVFLGWLPGRETAYAQMREDIWAAFETDHYGTKLEDITIMANANNLQDFSLVGVSCNTSPDDFMRQWSGKGVPLVCENGASAIPLMMPYIENGAMAAYMTTQKQAAEYESIIGFKGLPTRQQDAQAVGQLFLLSIAIIGNIVYWKDRIGGEKE
jgi:hypothetical protein